jgi:hypothetical protein
LRSAPKAFVLSPKWMLTWGESSSRLWMRASHQHVVAAERAG